MASETRRTMRAHQTFRRSGGRVHRDDGAAVALLQVHDGLALARREAPAGHAVGVDLQGRSVEIVPELGRRRPEERENGEEDRAERGARA